MTKKVQITAAYQITVYIYNANMSGVEETFLPQ